MKHDKIPLFHAPNQQNWYSFTMDINEKLENIFTQVFPSIPKVDIREVSIENYPEWDSLALMQIITMIENGFSITLGISEIKLLNSFRNCLSVIESKTD
jgi:acyl carrier protein